MNPVVMPLKLFRHLPLVLAFASQTAFAATASKSKIAPADAEVSIKDSSGSRKDQNEWRIQSEFGFSLNPHTRQVGSQWTHQPTESPALRITIPFVLKSLRNVEFLFAPDLVFLKSTQKISSSKASTTLTGQYLYLGASMGVAWRYQSWSFGGYLGIPISRLHEKTWLDSPGFTSSSMDLGVYNSAWHGLRVGYSFADAWEGSLSIFKLNESTCPMLGVPYAL